MYNISINRFLYVEYANVMNRLTNCQIYCVVNSIWQNELLKRIIDLIISNFKVL